MKLNNLNGNSAEIHKSDGTVVLFSYQTPVAACMGDGSGFVRTSTRYSVTTTKHINKWLDGAKAREVDQSVIDRLV